MPFSFCPRPVIGAGALVVFAVVPFGLSTAFAQKTAPHAPPAKVASAILPSAGYERVVKNKDGSAQAVQTAIRRFDPVRGNGPTVYLVAAIHIGEKDYYQRLQRFLDTQDVVLYEGVWSEKDTPSTTPSKSPVTGGNETKVNDEKVNDELVQLASVLNLHTQLDIDYQKPNLRHSDLSWEMIKALAAKSGVDTLNAVNALNNVVNGNLAAGGTVGEAFTSVITQAKKDPAFAKMLRRAIVELSANPKRMAQPQSAEMAKLEPIIVAERNKAVLADLKSLLLAQPTKGQKIPRSIAIFYGEGHMRGIGQHLVADMGYRPGVTEWLTAIKADP